MYGEIVMYEFWIINIDIKYKHFGENGWISPTCCVSTAFLPSISKSYLKFSNIDIKYEHFGENGVNFTNMLY
jgi:hypothetical protein